MTGSLARTAIARPALANQAQVLAMWRAQPGALMLLGRVPSPLPKSGSARIAKLPGASGMFRAEFWSQDGEPGYSFLAAIRLPHGSDRSDTGELLLRGARGADRDIPLTLTAASAGASFGKLVAESVGADAARLTRFMLDVMQSDDDTDQRHVSAVFEAFLGQAARVDGCIELIMHVPQRCVLLQGWGVKPTEPVDLLLPGSSLRCHRAASGDFPRSDVAAPATGSVLVFQPELVGAMGALDQIFLLIGNELLCRRVVEPGVIDVEASVGQIRHLLPRLNCSASMQALLRATLQPHYEGRDTLNASGRPVRAALDTAVAVMGRGTYLSGWLFDPACHTAELHLCAEGFSARLDESWVRVPRKDVSAAFCSDPAFPVPLSDQSGFAVAISAGPPPDRPAYLRFTFTDGELAFVPIRLTDPGAPSALSSLVASVDLHKSSGVAIVTQHLAPFIAQLPLLSDATSQILLRGPLERFRAIVVPLRSATLPRSFVSSFLLDPAANDEQIIFVCGPEWDHTQREALVGLVDFYQLPASIIGVAEPPRPAHAVLQAATVSQAECFLLASPGLVGNGPGWRESLRRAAFADPVACPTVLFEDRSLRFAGLKSISFLDRAPYIDVSAPNAGAFASAARAEFASAEPSTQGAIGTFACCLIRRAALPALARATHLMTESGQEAAFFLALHDAGLKVAWVPSVRVSAPEEDEGQPAPALPLIDGWLLRQSWGEKQCAF